VLFLQLVHATTSLTMACFSGAPVPANGFGVVFRHTMTQLVHQTYNKHCIRMSLGGSKLKPPQRFSVL
jgi:hypothetical protein